MNESWSTWKAGEKALVESRRCSRRAYLGPHGQMFEGAVFERSDDGVGNVSDTRLDRREVVRESSRLDLVGEEVDEVGADGARDVVLRGVLARVVRLVAFHNGYHPLRVNGHRSQANAVGGV